MNNTQHDTDCTVCGAAIGECSGYCTALPNELDDVEKEVQPLNSYELHLLEAHKELAKRTLTPQQMNARIIDAMRTRQIMQDAYSLAVENVYRAERASREPQAVPGLDLSPLVYIV
jgi:hypothetical protein